MPVSSHTLASAKGLRGSSGTPMNQETARPTTLVNLCQVHNSRSIYPSPDTRTCHGAVCRRPDTRAGAVTTLSRRLPR